MPKNASGGTPDAATETVALPKSILKRYVKEQARVGSVHAARSSGLWLLPSGLWRPAFALPLPFLIFTFSFFIGLNIADIFART
jgi:hypothetical protein